MTDVRRTLWSLVGCERHGGGNQSEKGNNLEGLHVDDRGVVIGNNTVTVVVVIAKDG